MDGVLDLDHLGPQATQELGGVGQGLHLLGRQHPDALEGLSVVGSLPGNHLTQSHAREGRTHNYPADQCEDS